MWFIVLEIFKIMLKKIGVDLYYFIVILNCLWYFYNEVIEIGNMWYLYMILNEDFIFDFLV